MMGSECVEEVWEWGFVLSFVTLVLSAVAFVTSAIFRWDLAVAVLFWPVVVSAATAAVCVVVRAAI